ncbi:MULTISPECIES: DAK2 domain-containing protein [unclassified Nocardia]|uniref:DAK2 domain-containing protein n=1 Tax=unclassified Nocardia TaxID=2637762 RepID=UPI0024A9DC2E|nr:MULTISPECIES: DAK2 domain-containing protein [unclassified Nocardia]
MPGEGDVFDGAALTRWGQRCLEGLERHRDEINALNVFPVADADTGNNLLTTMRAAVRAAEAETEQERPTADGAGPSAHAVAVVMARAATVGARGNSGIILSQVLRGMAEGVTAGALTAGSLRHALRRAAVLVREALSSPVEGTMLTILDRAAEHAADCADDALPAVALAAADGAAKALGETPTLLGVLREAGVVDAGARGLLVLLDELVAATGGRMPVRPAYVRRTPDRSGSGAAARRPGVVEAKPAVRPAADRSGAFERTDRRAAISGTVDWVADATGGSGCAPRVGGDETGGRPGRAEDGGVIARNRESTSGSAGRGGADVPVAAVPAPQYEVMYLLTRTDERRAGRLREVLAGLGDSVVVVGDGAGAWSAHVHCADAGAAVEAGLAAGALSRIRIETLAVSAHASAGPADRGILAVTSGSGAVRLFEDAGATVLEGEVTAEELLAAIRALPHREVLVLPNGALPAHELVAVSVAARDGNRDVLMLPCASTVQGLAALAMHDAGRSAADDVFAMSEAAAVTRWGALRVAAERALTIVGTCEAGDGLGLVGHDVVVIDPDVRSAARTLLDRMLGLGGELVTILLGAQAPAGLAEELTEHITAGFPGVEVVVYPGGQAGDLVQIGVE